MAATLLKDVSGLKRLAWGGLAVAFLAGAGWFWLQTADFAGAADIPDVLAALPIVAVDTRFGTLLIGRSLALLVAVLCLQCGWRRVAAVAAGGGVVAESWLGHGGAMSGAEGTMLLITAVFHLAAAAAWLGSLPALLLAVGRLPLAAAQRVAQKFSPYGMMFVVTLVITAGIQYFFLIGGLGALFTSAYGLTALFKMTALAALVALAAANRTKFVPALGTEPARRRLAFSITAEMALGLCTFLAAGLILQLTPPAMAYMAGQ